MRSLLTLAILTAATSLAGCHLYGGNGDHDDDWGDQPDAGCANVGGGGQQPYLDAGSGPAALLRNPETGQCESVGTGGGGGEPWPCDPACGPCATNHLVPAVTWGFCESQCSGLDEQTCLTYSGCRAIYMDWCPGADCAPERIFTECWSTDQSGPIQGGSCDGLSAFDCSMHDDCSAVHDNSCDQLVTLPDEITPQACLVGAFVSCQNEKVGCFEGDSCGAGHHCNAEQLCLSGPGCSEPGLIPCDDTCYGFCVPDGGGDPGTCYGDLTCANDPPDCPLNTVPGIADGCYTGYCIPLDECESVAACSALANEAACIARWDCAALYEGINCSCQNDTCSCEDWLYSECVDA